MKRSLKKCVWPGLFVALGAAIGFGVTLVNAPKPAPAADPFAGPTAAELAQIDKEIAAAKAADIRVGDKVYATGWVDDQLEVAAVTATMAVPRFAATPAGRANDPLPDHAYLWEWHTKKHGRPPPVMDQNPIGSCVGFGSSRAYERSVMCEIAAGMPFEFKHIAEEVTYAGSRVEIGGGRIRGDGSVGAWAAKFFTTYGGLPRGVYGRYDLTKYDPARCRQWGSSGVPAELEPEAKKYPVGSAALVKSVEELKRALANGYGTAECSNMLIGRQRDKNGCVGYGGAGGHCMCLDGYHVAPNGKAYFHVENSWGADYHVGPVGWGEPNTSGGWLHEDYVARYMLSGDTWAFSAVRGFPAKRMDWFAHSPPVPGLLPRLARDRSVTAAAEGQHHVAW